MPNPAESSNNPENFTPSLDASEAQLPFDETEPATLDAESQEEVTDTPEQAEAGAGVEGDFIRSLEQAFEKADQVGEARVAESEARLKEATELSAARQELLDRDNELYENAKSEAQEFITHLEAFSKQVKDTGLPPMRISKLLVSIHAAIELRKIELDNIEKNHQATKREIVNALPASVKVTRKPSRAEEWVSKANGDAYVEGAA